MIDVCNEQWMDSVNEYFEGWFGFGIDDMPDFDYTACYMADMSASQTLAVYLEKYPDYAI